MSLSLARARCPHSLHRLSLFARSYATAPPPPPRPYKSAPAPPVAKPAPEPSSPEPPKPQYDPPDPERGRAASMRAAQTGELDARYKPAARKVTAFICAVPILIWSSWTLYKRFILGEEQKRIVHRDPKVLPGEGDGEVVVDG